MNFRKILLVIPHNVHLSRVYLLCDMFTYCHGFYCNFYRTVLCIRGTSHGPVSVRLSQAGVLLKRQNVGSHRQNVGSHKQHHRDSSFLVPKISAKFDRGHPLRGRQMQVGWVKIGDFRQIAGYISKTVKDRHIVSIKVE